MRCGGSWEAGKTCFWNLLAEMAGLRRRETRRDETRHDTTRSVEIQYRSRHETNITGIRPFINRHTDQYSRSAHRGHCASLHFDIASRRVGCCHPSEVSAPAYFSLQMQIEKVHNPLEALILTMLLPGIAHIPPQREPMLDALENLDLVPVLSLVHDVDGPAPVLLLERRIVRGAGQEEGVFRKKTKTIRVRYAHLMIGIAWEETRHSLFRFSK